MSDELLSNLMQQLTPRKSPLSSYDVFATPGGGARPVRTIPAYEEGLEVSHLRFPEKLCLGLIGPTKVCCVSLDLCTIASHRTRRASDMDGSGKLLVRHTPMRHERPACYIAPYLATSGIADDLIAELLLMDDTDWGPTLSLITNGNIHSLEDYYKKQELMRTTRKALRTGDTPFKVEGRVESQTVLDSIMELVDVLQTVPSLVEKVDEVEESSGDDREVALVVAMKAITVRLDFLGRACQAALSGVNRVGHDGNHAERGVELSLESITAEVDTLKGLLGERGHLAGPSEPTLWGATNGLGSRMDALEKAAGLLHANLVNLRVESRVGHVTSDTFAGTGAPEDDSFSADTVMKDLLSSPNPGSGGRPGSRYVSQSGVLNNAERRDPGLSGTGNVNFGIANQNNFGGTGTASNRNLAGPTGETVDPESLSLISARLSKLEQKDGKRGAVEAVYFGDHFFGSEQDSLAFLEKHLGVGANFKFGALTSPYHILALLYKSLSGKSVGVAELAGLKRLNLGHNELDAYLAASVELPELFTATAKLSGHSYRSNTSVCSSARFKIFPSYADWGNEGDETSLYEKILRALLNVEDQVQANIRNAFRSSMEMKMLAIEMLNASTKFLRDLFSYMGNTYLHLFQAFSDSTAAWDLVCFAILEIFSNDFQPAKIDMANADIVTDVPACAATVFWTNLKLVQVAAKFSEVGIKNHPSMNRAYIRFILTQSSERQSAATLERTVREQEEVITSLKRKFDELDEKVKTYSNKCRHIESTVESTKNKVAAVEKDVKKLKNGGN